MFYPTDFLPEYMRYGFRTHQAFQQALYNGDLIREEVNPQKYYYPPYPYPMVYNAQPVIEQQNMIEFDMFNIEGVRGYYKIDENGNKIRLVNAEDIAKGAGLTREKSFHSSAEIRTESYVQWDRVNQYAQSRLPYLQQAGLNPILLQYIPEKIDRDSYIPIEVAIQIISCADSDQAKLFQAIVSITIAREIDKMIDNKYNEELKSLQGQINMKDRQLAEQKSLMNKTTEYYEEFNSTKHCFTSTEIAKQFGLSAQTLHQLLHHIGIIFPVNNTWQVYESYAHFGCLVDKNENGKIGTYWTNNGRMIVIMKLQQYGFVIGQDNTNVVDRILNQ